MTRPFNRFLRNRTGSASVEFAILAPMFIAVLFSTFEVGWLITKATLLDRAVEMTVRDMRVGATGAPTTQAQMITAICQRLYFTNSCESALTVELTRITSSADFPTSDAVCVDRGSSVSPAVNFTAGSRAEIMYVRACLVSDALVPYFGIALNFHKDSRGGYSIVSTSAFMNEPGD